MSRKKFELIAEFFRSSNLDFCFVQETMISKESKIASLSASWRGPSFWAPAVGRRGGVVILCSQDYSDQVSVWQKDSNGRIVSLLVQCDSVKLNLVNVYVPTVPAERKDQQFRTMLAFIEQLVAVHHVSLSIRTGNFGKTLRMI